MVTMKLVLIELLVITMVIVIIAAFGSLAAGHTG